MVRAATCGRALSYRNDTDICAFYSWRLSLLGLREVPSNIRRLLCDNLWGNPVRPNDCINAVTVLACYGISLPALTRVILHRFPSFFKNTAPLIDTNIWQCLLTILPLQSWTDFRRFTTFFLQEFDYNTLFNANVYLRFDDFPYNWQNCAVANTRSLNDLGSVLSRSTYDNFQRTALHFLNYEQIIIHICRRLVFREFFTTQARALCFQCLIRSVVLSTFLDHYR